VVAISAAPIESWPVRPIYIDETHNHDAGPNFRHIVHFQKIPMYNGVNLAHGHGSLAIHTPQEMLHYEDNIQGL